MMIQKFRRNALVRINKEEYGRRGGGLAIVNGSYAQTCTSYSKKDFHKYSLWTIENGKITNCQSWFYEKDLELVNDNYETLCRSEVLIEEYLLRGME